MTSPTAAPFVPADLDAADLAAVSPLFDALLQREVDGPDAFGRWLADRSELDAACGEAHAVLYIAMTRRTDDKAAADAYTRFVREVEPELRKASFTLDRRQAELHGRIPLDPDRYAVLERDVRNEVALFREENIPVETELTLLAQKYEETMGAMTVEFEGEERTLPQMARYTEKTDRALRESAWRAVAARRMQEADNLDALFESMLPLRQKVAYNAGFADYRDYAFRARRRFDYSPDDCAAFHEACATVVTPLCRRLDAQRRTALGVDPLRPWDLAVDVQGRDPLRPFEGAEALVDACAALFNCMDPDLGAMFESLREGDCLDLETRKGKAPGGYQYMRDRSRKPFIFMNAAGMHHDVRTMIHEAGHAFHSLLCADEPLVHYRHTGAEFAEVASMSMELLTMDRWSAFYPDTEDEARAVREQLEGVVSVLPWVAQVDAFQHWVYTNPGHTREQRHAHWVALDERLGRGVSWEGLARERARTWQRQLHIFTLPFYYIEYGIAQLGALQLWLRARTEGDGAALRAYKHALSIGGAKPLPELFGAAGLDFDFGPDNVARLADEVERTLESLPA